MSNTIQHSLIPENEKHTPQAHSLTGDRHIVPEGINNKILSVEDSALSFKTFAEIVSTVPDHPIPNGAIWYDEGTDRFLCRRANETHILITQKKED